ncbi:MAG: 4Fe-4S binding protein [Ruminococcus sp.]
MLVKRFFCRYFCPMGAVYALISRGAFLKIEKLGRECSACSLCTAKCSMGIDFTKRNKLQVESALRASSALAGARKEMCILELNMEW